MSKINLGNFLKVIRSKWNIIVTIISVLGVLVFSFIPDMNDNFFKLFVFLGINAIVWTLIEIKLKLDEKNPNTTDRFDGLRNARSHILEHIYQCMKTNKSDELHIEIVGVRFKMIGDMMRDIKDRIVKKEIISRNVRISLYAVNPELLRHWNFSKTQSNSSSKEINEEHASFIELSKKEFLKYNDLIEFKSNNIKVEVDFYNTFPLIYSFKIGDEHIYWGFVAWDNSGEDFKLPGNPCYYLKKKHTHFNDFHKILSNKTEFYKSCKIADYDG